MNGEKFTLMQYSISAILGLIEAEDFVIPEIQRPFVWKRSQVRDLIDSLYNGYPTGYIITWKNPDVQTKDGGKANGKKVLIDGQQRITALMASIAGKDVLDQDFNKDRMRYLNRFADDPLAVIDSIFRVVLPNNGYNIREEQIALAKKMYIGFTEKQVALCEAEVGTGKTLSYLVAAIVAKHHNGIRNLPVPIFLLRIDICIIRQCTTYFAPLLFAASHIESKSSRKNQIS